MATENQPLSPHLQVYRPQLTSVMSISHRVTGVWLAVGSLVLACWLVAAAAGPEAFAAAQGIVGGWFGQLLMITWAYAFFYHLCNGIRHLFWDAGYGFELKAAYASGWSVLLVSLGLWALALIIAYAVVGGGT